ncbi:neo-calmodulin [Eurytemora carolleeae]|uniref:neo-calmodulin n=1 Tax=Eurytemora carolleeae TaxID=1294199 RepID=UPI000C78DE39|nr:neo-calmodulin [Eurytemora carolleeae]|eukprot:XP_023331275.1 neo-calmodulin-like [Eurytemora affinis]
MATSANPFELNKMKVKKKNIFGDVEFTDQQMEEFKEAFVEFDIDGDGTITKEELGTVMRRLGERPTEEELQEMVSEVDQDGSGAIELDEFIQMMANRISEGNKIKQVFDFFDKNDDGYISSAELTAVMLDLGEQLTEDEIEEMMRWADKDGDGRVGYSEFAALMSGKSRSRNFD